MNSVGYFEIQADDPGEAVTFYKEIFGWEFFKDEKIPIEYYQIKTAGINGGLLKRPTNRPDQQQGTNAFVCSMVVEYFDQTAKKILEYGGLIALDKFAIPGRCWQGYFLDSQGNTFGIFQVDSTAS